MSNTKIIDYEVMAVPIGIEPRHELGPMIKDGWQPYGNPFCFDIFGRPHLVQAMIKYSYDVTVKED
jgi:hypothetical protein